MDSSELASIIIETLRSFNMSFVSIVVCENYISAMADSRGSELYSDGRYHRTISENEEKIIVVNDKIFYSVTGLSDSAHKFINDSNFVADINSNGKLKKKTELSDWLIKNSLINVSEVLNYTIYFGGLAVDDKFRVYHINSGKDDLAELEYAPGNMSYILSQSYYWGNDDFPKRLFCELSEKYYNGTLQSMQSIQKQLNDAIADNDPSVNKIAKAFYITRL